MKQIIYLKIAKYIDRNCSMQIIAFLEQSLHFLAGNMETIVYMSINRIKRAVLCAISIMFVPCSTITRISKIDICSNK